MTPLMAILGLITAMAAAVRSTWSPCGLSMLSTITPVGERGPGHGYRSTAPWFILGATLGGVTLGGVGAILAAGVAALQLPAGAVLSIAAAGSVLAAAGDLGFGLHFPLLRRQVNERWLDQFRAWVYGVGFGWQIGVGVATYIMTAAVFLAVLLAALTAIPLVAVGIGTAFGLTRGLAVLLSRRLTTAAQLRAFHQRLDAFSGRSRSAIIALELTVALVAAGIEWPLAGALLAAGVFGSGLAAVAIRNRAARAAG